MQGVIEAGTRVKVDMVEDTEVVEEVVRVKLATPAEDMATCPGIALRVRNATIVSDLLMDSTLACVLTLSGGEVGHLSRDCPSEASQERVCYKCKQPGHVQAACPN